MSIENEAYKVLISVKDIIEKNKSLSSVTCKVKFNQITQSSPVPFKQSLTFNLSLQDAANPLEVRFERDFKEFAKVFLKLENHHFTRRFDVLVSSVYSSNLLKTEKWVETENTETNSKIYVKVSFSVVKLAPDNKAKMPSRVNNFMDSKSQETSPRLNYATTSKTSLQSSQVLTLQEENDSESMASFRKPSNMSNSMKLPPSGMLPPKDSTSRILSKYPELKLNLKKALKDVVEEATSSKEDRTQSWKSRNSATKPENSSKGSKGSKRSKGTQKIRKEHKPPERQKVLTNSKISQLKLMKKSRKKQKNSKINLFLHLRIPWIYKWKQTSWLLRIKLLEDEVKSLRGFLSAQETRNNEIEKAMIKKELEFETMLREIEKENKRCRDEIKKLEEKIVELKNEKSQLKIEKDNIFHENNILKARILNLEMNSELVRQFSVQRESMLKEINNLRDINDKLREALGKQRRESSGEPGGMFFESVDRIKKRIESVSSQSISCLQKLKSKRASTRNLKKLDHLDLNFDLKSNMEDVESCLNLDTFEVFKLDSDSDEEPEGQNEDFEAELEKNLAMVGALSEHNKRLERCIYTEKTFETENSVLGKQKSFDNHSSTGSLKNSQSSSQLLKVRSDKSTDYKKPMYLAIKEDPIDQKLGEYINNHKDLRKLMCLFKRRSNGMYMFGSKKVFVKLENGKLFVKAGQLQLPIDKFLNLNLDLEADKAGNEASRFKKGPAK